MAKKFIIEVGKSAVKYEATIKAADDAPWDGRDVVKELRKWASSDGKGLKEKMNWAKYRRAFAWYNADKPEEFGSYKLPHHMNNSSGSLVVLFRGLAAAFGSLQGARGGLSIPDGDRAGVKAHIAKHYKQFGRTISTSKHFNSDNPKALEIFKAMNGVDFNEVDMRTFLWMVSDAAYDFLGREHPSLFDEFGNLGCACEVFETLVIFWVRKDSKHFAIPWKSKNDEFIFGEPYQVKQKWVKVEGSDDVAVEKSLTVEIKKMKSLWEDII